MKASKIRDQYINNYAEPEAKLIDCCALPAFDHCLIIPCFDEKLDFINRLESREELTNNLFIIVVNQAEGTSTNRQNQNALQHFQNKKTLIWKNKHLQFYSNKQQNWLVVERCKAGNQIPIKQGVGLARKIGSDIAVQLYAQNKLKSPWLHSSDADTHLPTNYFNIPFTPNVSAAVYSYKHICDASALGKATHRYEQALNYYVEGLKWAGSPYAFHTIGSALAFNIDSYCQARGFPKRAGGEDFYLLNKLAKVGKIIALEDICLEIDARESSRVPFGTGPAVSKIINMDEQGETYTYYAPEIFSALKTWINFLNDNWPSPETIFNSLPKEVKNAAAAIEAEKFFAHAKKQAKDQSSYRKFAHQWFDGFKTLKFVHYLQKNNFADIPLEKCLSNAPW